jgi:YHYH protein/Secretion system C-terminal sorting domain/SLA1 homology domain 1, SHD1
MGMKRFLNDKKSCMSSNKSLLYILPILFCLLGARNLFAHGHKHAHDTLKKWTITTEKKSVRASFLMFKDGEVYLEKANDKVVHFPIASFSEADQGFVKQKYAKIEQLNDLKISEQRFRNLEGFGNDNRAQHLQNLEGFINVVAFGILGFSMLFFLFFRKKNRKRGVLEGSSEFLRQPPETLKGKYIGSKKLVVFAQQPPTPKGEYIASNLDGFPSRLMLFLGILRTKCSSYLGFTPPLRGRGAVAKSGDAHSKATQISFTLMLITSLFLFSFKTQIAENLLSTDPLFIDSAFQPFKPSIATHWDNTWFYVESKGIPDHEMMTGITNWQQQVPIPQCYIGANAWQIPLNPVLAATPVPVNAQHFSRGAVAIATNGLPIFNPFTNTGVDAFLDGQLDNFGGHCGRADDYHYHTAPLHLDAQTPDILPIAFALDGFAIYGSLEPDGATMSALDANHGHFDAAGVYHYHGTSNAPYMIGNMVGKVTEDATMQIIPQAKAMPIRPAGMPLQGATITGCVANAAGNGYVLTYTKGGQTFSIDYKWPSAGQYKFDFISAAGTTTQNFNGFVQCEVPTTAINDIFANKMDFSVFPNPTTGDFSLKLKEEINWNDVHSVSVFDSKGKLVWLKSEGFNALPTLQSKGIYLVKIDMKKGECTRKIVVY